MGTSSSYPGRKGDRHLLPPWADPTPPPPGLPDLPPPALPVMPPEATRPEEMAPPEQGQPALPAPRPVSWRAPKSALGRYARGEKSASLGKVMKSYVRASGGSRTATASARAGRASTIALGSFLGDVARSGVAEAARARGLPNITGRNIQAVLASLINVLSPVGSTLEEAAARKSVITTLTEAFKKFGVEEKGIEVLDQLEVGQIRELLEMSVTNYVNERFQQELMSRLELGTITEKKANEISIEIKAYIGGMVRLDLREVDPATFDWQGVEGRALAGRIFSKAYGLLGAEQ